MHIEFVDARTEDEKLAILTCPGYDEVFERAKGDLWEEKNISYACPPVRERDRQITAKWRTSVPIRLASCPVSLCLRGSIYELIIRGKCLMGE